MPDHNSPIDEIIHNAMRRGEFDDLPGAGKPLALDDEAHIPAELRLAHRILKQNDLAPDWILLGKEIEAEREAALAALDAAARTHAGARSDARRSAKSQQMLEAAEVVWAAAREAFRAAYCKLNQKILRYNLKLPPGFPHKPSLNAERELARKTAPR
jgi:hypothetical protein